MEFSIIELFLLFILLLIYPIIIGSIMRAYFLGYRKFQFLQKTILFFANIPSKIFYYLKKLPFSNCFSKSAVLLKHKDKAKFTKFNSKIREGLLVIPRYDHFEKRSLVEIIDLKDFKTIHSYKHDIQSMNKRVKNKKYFPGLNTISGPKTFLYWDPLILNDGSLICDANPGPEFKIDYNSNLIWINDEIIFHHSKILDHENNCW